MEAVYGSSLTEFFNDWIFNQGYPSYTITAQNWGAGQVKVIVNQTQSSTTVSYFEMPVPLRFVDVNGQIFDTVVNNTTNGQEFIISVPFSITGVEFDPKKDIISKDNNISLANEIFDLEKAISLYPNPATDVLHIQLPTSITLEKVTIFNNLGQVVLENNAIDFSLSSISSGVYAVQLQTSEGVFHKKIIKN